MRIEKYLSRKVLEKLYKDYFPDSCLTPELYKALSMEKESKSALAVITYLEDKELIVESKNIDQQRKWRITASGIDLVEERDLLEPEPGKPDFWTVNMKN